jgi:hypothetical protein
MREWKLLDWAAYLLFAYSIGMQAIKESIEKSPVLHHYAPGWVLDMDSGLTGLIAFVIASLLIVARQFGWIPGFGQSARHTPSARAFLRNYQTLKQVFNRTYNNQTVRLDGHEYCDCTFVNCTLIFDGVAPVRFTNVKFSGTAQFGGLNPVVQNTLSLMDAITRSGGGGITIKRIDTDDIYK